MVQYQSEDDRKFAQIVRAHVLVNDLRSVHDKYPNRFFGTQEQCEIAGLCNIAANLIEELIKEQDI